MRLKHQWKLESTAGTAPGAGTPAGVQHTWRCRRCGALKMTGPGSDEAGRARMVVHYAVDGYVQSDRPPCRH